MVQDSRLANGEKTIKVEPVANYTSPQNIPSQCQILSKTDVKHILGGISLFVEEGPITRFAGDGSKIQRAKQRCCCSLLSWDVYFPLTMVIWLLSQLSGLGLVIG